MRWLGWLLLLALPALAETEVRHLQNDSDASVQVHRGGEVAGSFERFGEGPLHVAIPHQDSDSLEIKSRAGLTRLYEADGLLYAVVNGAAPRAISNRADQYVTLFIDSQGQVRVWRWKFWYN